MQSCQIWGDRLHPVFAGLLLLVLAAELGFFARRQSQTIDEADHIHAGYRYWQCADFGVNPEHPPFAKLVDTLPLVFDRPKNPGPPCASYDTGTFPDFAHGHDFLYSNDAGRILAETRLFAASFTVMLAIFVFLAARRMFGKGPALFALLLLVFEPTVLAHGAEVTTDLPVTCWLFGAVYAFYRYTESPSALRLIFSGLTAGLALATKHSAAVLLPILVLLEITDIWVPRRDSASTGPSGGFVKRIRPRLIERAAAPVVIISIATAILWGCYLFRYSARPAGHEMSDSLTTYIQDATRYGGVHSVLLSQMIPRMVHVVPEAYLYGLANVAIASSGRLTFLLGHLYPTGQWFYFPIAFVIKSTLAFLLLLALTLFAIPYMWREKKRETLFLTIPAAVFFSVSLISRLNIGIRHILPIFPFLIVLAAGAAWRLAGRKRMWMYAVVALAALHCVSSLRAFPNYLSYSNEAWGGPRETYHYLANSNVDSGGGLVDERNFLVRNRITDCWIAAFGSADLDYYGIPCKILTAFSPQKRSAAAPRPLEGTLLISTSVLAGTVSDPPELNPYGPLWHEEPVANLGGHTLVFQGRFDLPLLSAAGLSTQAQILASQGRLDEALAEARTAVGMAPQRMQTHISLLPRS